MAMKPAAVRGLDQADREAGSTWLNRQAAPPFPERIARATATKAKMTAIAANAMAA